MNWKDIEEAKRIHKELRNAREINEEFKNARKIYDELNSYKNKLSNFGEDKDLINPRNAARELQLQRDEIRRIKEFQNPNNNFGIADNFKFQNELFESRRSLQKMLEREDQFFNKSLVEARRNFDSVNNFDKQYIRQNQKEINQVKNDYLRNRNGIDQIRADYLRSRDEINQIRDNYLNRLPKWQEQILPALAIRRSEVEDILNNRRLLKEQLEFIPNNFRRQEFWNQVDNLRDTYVGNLAISMREAIYDSIDNDEAIEKIESLFEEKVAILPQNQFSREFVINLFLTILLTILQLWYSHYLSNQSSIELKTLFGETSQRLEKIERSVSNNDTFENDDIYYVVQRTVSAKNRPDFKSLTIDYLSPNTKVRLLKSKHKWIYVEYIDYLEVIPRYGWVSKKYLKRLEN